MIPFVGFGWFLHGLWLVFHVFFVVFFFFHGSSWFLAGLHSTSQFLVFWLVFMLFHGFRLVFQVFYWDLFMKDQRLGQLLHIWPSSHREVRWPLVSCPTIFHHSDLEEWLHSIVLGDHPKRSEGITQSRFQSVTKNDHFLKLHPNEILDLFASNYIRKWEHNTRVCSSYCQLMPLRAWNWVPSLVDDTETSWKLKITKYLRWDHLKKADHLLGWLMKPLANFGWSRMVEPSWKWGNVVAVDQGVDPSGLPTWMS